MGIHYDYKSTRGAKAMEKQAKRERKLAEKRAKKNEEEVRSKVAKKLNIKVADVENMENRFIHEDKSLNAKVSDDYNQEFGNFIIEN